MFGLVLEILDKYQTVRGPPVSRTVRTTAPRPCAGVQTMAPPRVAIEDACRANDGFLFASSVPRCRSAPLLTQFCRLGSPTSTTAWPPFPPLSRPEGPCPLPFMWQLPVAWAAGKRRLQASAFHRCHLPHGAHRRLPSTSGPTRSIVSSLFIPCCSPTCGSALAASCPRRWSPPLRHRLPRRRQAA
jgi:hypothetical protein